MHQNRQNDNQERKEFEHVSSHGAPSSTHSAPGHADSVDLSKPTGESLKGGEKAAEEFIGYTRTTRKSFADLILILLSGRRRNLASPYFIIAATIVIFGIITKTLFNLNNSIYLFGSYLFLILVFGLINLIKKK